MGQMHDVLGAQLSKIRDNILTNQSRLGLNDNRSSA